MKVKNIVFSGVMATILGATSANAAAISVASQGYVDSKVKANTDAIAEITKIDGTIDTKVAAAVAPLATAQSVTDLGTTVSTTYQTKADAESQHQALQGAIDSKVAQATYEAKMQALDALDGTFATKESVGILPQDTTATTIVGYIQEKTDGIATSENLEALTGRVTAAEGEIDALQGSVNKLDGDENTDGSVKKQIADAIASEVSRSDDAYAAKTIEATVSSQGDKITALEGQFGETGATTQAIAAAQGAADAAKTAADAAQEDADTNAEAIAAINNAESGILAQAKSYTDTQDAATLASAKTYAEEQASAAQAAAEATAASELASAMQSIATAYLEKPAECATTYCVLSVTGKGENESITWMPLTEPQSEYYPLPPSLPQ